MPCFYCILRHSYKHYSDIYDVYTQMKRNASKKYYRCRFERYNLVFLFAKVKKKERILDIQVNVSTR